MPAKMGHIDSNSEFPGKVDSHWLMSLQDLFNNHTVLGESFMIAAFCLNVIYGTGPIDFTALMVFTFMGFLVFIIANHGG